MIYLDSSATSYYRPPQVAEAIAQAVRTMGNCGRGAYGPAMESARVIFETRQLVDELFDGWGPEQVVFTANATESLNIAIKGLLSPGEEVVTTVLEHNSVLRPLHQMEELGVKVVYVDCLGSKEPPDSLLRQKGILDMEGMRRAIHPGVKAVICTHISNLTGNVQDIRTIGEWCRKARALLIVDASQSVGILPLSMKKDQIDVLCFTGHKGLMGPQGTGGLCVRKGIKIRPLLTGGSGIKTYSRTHPETMPEALEAGTLNGHGIAGLRAALAWIKEQGGVRGDGGQAAALAREFYRQVKEIPGIRIYGDWSSALHGPVVSLNLGQEDSGQLSDWLAWEREIDTRAGGHCAPMMHQALGTRNQGAVRFSFSRFNTLEEVRAGAEALKEYQRETE